MLRRLTLLLLAGALCAAAQTSVRALIANGWYDHAFLDPLPQLERLLSDSGRFELKTTEKLTAAQLSGRDVLVVLYNGPRWGAEIEKAVEQFVSSGKGMVTIHGATYAFGGAEVRKLRFKRSGIIEPPWEEFVRMIGSRWPEEKLGHGERHVFEVRFTDRTHPVTRGLGPSISADDELYHRIEILPHARVLATAFSDPATRGTGENEPIVWTTTYGKGRVLHTTLGHDAKALQKPGVIQLLTRAAEWAATGEVSSPSGR